MSADRPQDQPSSDAPPIPDVPVGGTLGSKTVRGGLATAGGQGVKVVLNAAGLIILARLLAPEDFGLIAMVAPLLTLVALFQDFGLSTATVQRRTITTEQSSNLFWFNVAASSALGLMVAALAPVVAAFYGDNRLVPITIAFGGLVMCSGLTAQHLALLTRHMQFALMAKQDAASLFVGLTSGVLAAWQGLGYWSLVISMASRSITVLVLVWIASEWRPGRPSRRTGVRSMLRFGRDLTLVRFGGFLIENLDSVLVGRFWGSYPLGLYDRAYSLLQLYKQVNGPVNSIAVAVLSKLQNDPARFRHYYVKGLGLVTGFSMPFIAFLAANATDVVGLALGYKWTAAVPIFLALIPATFIGTIKPATWWIYSSLGQTDRQLRWVLRYQVPLTIVSFFVGLPFGPVGVAIAYSTITVALRPPSILYCLQDFKEYLRLRDVLAATLPAAFASIAAACLQAALKHFLFPPLSPISAVPADAALYGTLYLLIYCALPIGRANVALYARMLSGALKTRH